ncbi:MAG: hypothetical protein Kow0065_22120 [Methylomicrobium sp.]
MNILFVNDSKLIERILRQSLSALGVHPRFCGNIAESLNVVKEQHFDFIAVSSYLTDGNGIDLIRHLRTLDGYCHTPIVLMTAETAPDRHIQAYRAGATDIFAKQHPEELVNFISRLLRHEAQFDAALLYVEDSPAQAQPMISLLQNHGLEVDWFSTAEEALVALHNKVYDLVLTDIVLHSAMQGTMFATHIRRMNGDIGDIPILALTAYDKIDSRIALFQIGIDDYVSKPVIEEELLPRIFRLVERQRLLRSLKQQEEAAQRFNQAKTAFLAQMSHEIRTPLAGIVGTAELLDRTSLDAQQRHLVSLLTESSKSALSILNDILDLSKVEAGKLDIELIPMNLREVIEGAVRMVLTSAHTKSIDLTLFISPELPKTIVSDPTRIGQIVLNLLTNAVKFTGNSPERRGSIHIQTEPSKMPSGQVGLKLCVIDNGIGITEEAQQRLFQPFTQAEESTYRKFGGTGLGLNIVKILTEKLGGQISIKSVPNQGSEFCLEWPLTVPEAIESTIPPELLGVSVGIVSEDQDCTRIAKAYAKEAGASVLIDPRLESAVAWLKRAPGDKVLILDQTDLPPNADELIAPFALIELIDEQRPALWPESMGLSARPLFFRAFIDAIKTATQSNAAMRITPLGTVEAEPTCRHHILIAEDSVLSQELFKAQMDLLGIEAVIANDGLEALELWRQHRYALLLTDCNMPNMDGFELTRQIRAEECAEQRTIIVAITANAMKGEAEQCLAHGMDDYIAKPASLDDLKNLLQKWIDT